VGGVTLNLQFRLTPRLRMTGTIPPLLYTPSWRGRGQLYLFMCEHFPLCVCGLFNDAGNSPNCIAPSRRTIRDNLSFFDLVLCLRTVFFRFLVHTYQKPAGFYLFHVIP
jgi:hypothetical protein